MNWEFSFPCTANLGPFKVTVTGIDSDTAKEQALWHYNRALAHDGNAPVDELPDGTTVKFTT